MDESHVAGATVPDSGSGHELDESVASSAALLPMIDVLGLRGRAQVPTTWADFIRYLSSLNITAAAPQLEELDSELSSSHAYECLLDALRMIPLDAGTTPSSAEDLKRRVLSWMSENAGMPETVPPTSYNKMAGSIRECFAKRRNTKYESATDAESGTKDTASENRRLSSMIPPSKRIRSTDAAFDIYLKQLSEPRAWADELVVCAAAHCFNVRIELFVAGANGAMTGPVLLGPSLKASNVTVASAAATAKPVRMVLVKEYFFALFLDAAPASDVSRPFVTLDPSEEDEEEVAPEVASSRRSTRSKTASAALEVGCARANFVVPTPHSVDRDNGLQSSIWIQCDQCEFWRFAYMSITDQRSLPKSWKCGGLGTSSTYEKRCGDPPIYLIMASFSAHYGDELADVQFQNMIKTHRHVVLDLTRLFLDIHALGGIETVVRLGKMKEIALQLNVPFNTGMGAYLHQRYNDTFRTRKILRDPQSFNAFLRDIEHDTDCLLGVGSHAILPRSSSLEQYIIDRLEVIIRSNPRHGLDLHTNNIRLSYGVTQRALLAHPNAMTSTVAASESTLLVTTAQMDDPHHDSKRPGFSEDVQQLLRSHKSILQRDEITLDLSADVRNTLGELCQLMEEHSRTTGIDGGPRDTLVLLGDSGSGKSFIIDTLLRISARNPLAYIENFRASGRNVSSSTEQNAEGSTDATNSLIFEASVDDPLATVVVVNVMHGDLFPAVNLYSDTAPQRLKHGNGRNSPFLLPSYSGTGPTTAISTSVRGATAYHLMVTYKDLGQVVQDWHESKAKSSTQAADQFADLCNLERTTAHTLFRDAQNMSTLMDHITENVPMEALKWCSGSKIFVGDGDDPQKHRLLMAELLRRIHGISNYDSVKAPLSPDSSSHPLLRDLRTACAFGKRAAVLIDRIIVYADCAFAPMRETELLDCPGTNDTSSVRDNRLHDDFSRAKQVVCVTKVGLSTGKDVVTTLKSWDYMADLAATLTPLSREGTTTDFSTLPPSKLAVIVNWETQLRSELELAAERACPKSSSFTFYSLSKLDEYRLDMERMVTSTACELNAIALEALRKSDDGTYSIMTDERPGGCTPENVSKYVPITPVALVDGANAILDTECAIDESIIVDTGMAALIGHFERLLGTSSFKAQARVLDKARELLNVLTLGPMDAPRQMGQAEVREILDRLQAAYEEFRDKFCEAVRNAARHAVDQTAATIASEQTHNGPSPLTYPSQRRSHLQADSAELTALSRSLQSNFLSGAAAGQRRRLQPALFSIWHHNFVEPVRLAIMSRLPKDLDRLLKTLDEDFEAALGVKVVQNQCDFIGLLRLRQRVQTAITSEEWSIAFLDGFKYQLEELHKTLFGPTDRHNKKRRLSKYMEAATATADHRHLASVATLTRHIDALVHGLRAFRLVEYTDVTEHSTIVQLGLHLAQKYRRQRWAEDAARLSHVVDALNFGNAGESRDVFTKAEVANGVRPHVFDPSLHAADLEERLSQVRMSETNRHLLERTLKQRGLALAHTRNARRSHDMNLFAAYLRVLGLNGSQAEQDLLRKMLKQCIKSTAEINLGIPVSVMAVLIGRVGLTDTKERYFGHPLWCLVYLATVLLKRPLHLYVSWKDEPYRFDASKDRQTSSLSPGDAIAFLGCNGSGTPLFDVCTNIQTEPTKRPLGRGQSNLLGAADDGHETMAITTESTLANMATDVRNIMPAEIAMVASTEMATTAATYDVGQPDENGMLLMTETSGNATMPHGDNIAAPASEYYGAVGDLTLDLENDSASVRATPLETWRSYPFATYTTANFQYDPVTSQFHNRWLRAAGPGFDHLRFSENELAKLRANFWQLNPVYRETEAKTGKESENRDTYYCHQGFVAVFDGVSQSQYAQHFLRSLINQLVQHSDRDYMIDVITGEGVYTGGPPPTNISKLRLSSATADTENDHVRLQESLRRLDQTMQSDDVHGTSTAAMVSLVRVRALTGMAEPGDFAFHGATIGDSRWMILRPVAADGFGLYKVVAASSFPEGCYVEGSKKHKHTPKQFGWHSATWPDLNDWIEDKIINDVCLNDLVLLGTDGFFDNIILTRADVMAADVVELVNRFAASSQSMHQTLNERVRNLGTELFQHALSNSRLGQTYSKPDDVTLVLSLVSVIST